MLRIGVNVMMWRICLWSGLCLSAMPAQCQTRPELASAEWSVLSTPTRLGGKPSHGGRETTQSIARRAIPTQPGPTLEPGWTLSSNEASASLVYATAGKASSDKNSANETSPVGFICRKGDGFVTFRSPPVSQAAGKRVLVLLKSANGTIRIETKVGSDGVITGESPVRTSSLVFVLTPKKGDARLTVGPWSAEIEEGTSDVLLLRFQSLCDQPIMSADAD